MFRTVAGLSILLTVVILAGTAGAVLALGGTPLQAGAWAVALTLASRLLPILASFPVAFWPRRAGRARALRPAVLARVVVRELWATVLLFFFYHPFERLVARPAPARVEPGETPVVLVHGFYANAGFWRRIQRALAAAGWHNLFTVSLAPPFADIDFYAVQLEDRIREVCERCGVESVIVVAHSMGGLVARACARRGNGRIRHILCLGTPHGGTVLASLVPAVNTRQMRRGSGWLQALNAAGAGPVPVTNVYSDLDNIIVPQASAALRGAANTRITGVAHLDMAFSPIVVDTLIDALRQAGAGSAA